MRLNGRLITGRRTIGRLVLGVVTVFEWAYHPGHLSLLPSVGRKMSTGQSAVICGWE